MKVSEMNRREFGKFLIRITAEQTAIASGVLTVCGAIGVVRNQVQDLQSDNSNSKETKANTDEDNKLYLKLLIGGGAVTACSLKAAHEAKKAIQAKQLQPPSTNPKFS